MKERTTKPSLAELDRPAADESLGRFPRIVVSRLQAAILVVIFYGLAFEVGSWGFYYIASVRGHDLGRSALMTNLLAVLVGSLAVVSLIGIVRTRRRPIR